MDTKVEPARDISIEDAVLYVPDEPYLVCDMTVTHPCTNFSGYTDRFHLLEENPQWIKVPYQGKWIKVKLAKYGYKYQTTVQVYDISTDKTTVIEPDNWVGLDDAIDWSKAKLDLKIKAYDWSNAHMSGTTYYATDILIKENGGEE